MNVFAKFDEIPSMILQDIKETTRYGHTVGRSFVQLDVRMDNVKTVYPPTNTVCWGGIITCRVLTKPWIIYGLTILYERILLSELT